MRIINSLNLAITTFCDRQCPTCCCAMPQTSPQHLELPYLKGLALYFFGLERLMITGGEPTLHPRFIELAPLLRNWFQPGELSITSNGSRINQYFEAMEHFDTIHLSVFEDYRTYPGSYSNTKELSFFAERFRFPERIVWEKIVHLHHQEGASYPCSLAYSRNVAFQNGLLYPCCPGPGQKKAKGIPVSKNWRKEILEVPFPCSLCPFAFIEEQEQARKSKNQTELTELHQQHREDSIRRNLFRNNHHSE